MIITISPPALEPITVAQVKSAARIDGSDRDADIAMTITAIRWGVEARLGRRLINQTIEVIGDDLDVAFDLIVPDVSSVVSVTYTDAAATQQTLDPSRYSLVARNADAAYLMPATGATWPDTAQTPGCVRARVIAGYGSTADSVPADIRHWMILRAAQLAQSSDGLVDQSIRELPYVDGLLDAHRVYRMAA